MASNGIVRQSSCLHSSQQNGVAEQTHCRLIEMTHTLLLDSSVPIKLWSDVVLFVGYLINRMPSSIFDNQVPHSLLYLKEPLYIVPPHIFCSMSGKCVFLGYSRV